MSAELVVALDVASFAEARKLVEKLYPRVKIFKVGSQLFTACGPKAVEYIKRKGARVFLDLKFHDIPNTVANSVAQAARLGVFMLTVHAQGGEAMMKAACQAAVETAGRLKRKRPFIVAVTVLTSEKAKGVRRRVSRLAGQAVLCGMDGVVASAQECASLKSRFKRKVLVVTPGIRPKGAARQDQRRLVTPGMAVEAGSDFLVVGRPVVGADDPRSAAEDILRQMEGSR